MRHALVWLTVLTLLRSSSDSVSVCMPAGALPVATCTAGARQRDSPRRCCARVCAQLLTPVRRHFSVSDRLGLLRVAIPRTYHRLGAGIPARRLIAEVWRGACARTSRTDQHSAS